MPRLPRPRTEGQRAAATTLVNVVFAALIAWLLSGALPGGTDAAPTSSTKLDTRGR